VLGWTEKPYRRGRNSTPRDSLDVVARSLNGDWAVHGEAPRVR
jgi:hypothetical protein